MKIELLSNCNTSNALFEYSLEMPTSFGGACCCACCCCCCTGCCSCCA